MVSKADEMPPAAVPASAQGGEQQEPGPRGRRAAEAERRPGKGGGAAVGRRGATETGPAPWAGFAAGCRCFEVRGRRRRSRGPARVGADAEAPGSSHDVRPRRCAPAVPSRR